MTWVIGMHHTEMSTQNNMFLLTMMQDVDLADSGTLAWMDHQILYRKNYQS